MQFANTRVDIACTQVDAAHTLSQAFSGGLPSPACAISISAAPAAISQMDLSASSATLTQPAASSASAGAVPPAIAAQHAHIGSDADSHPEPSPNYRMDHVLANSLHSRMHASHDFGPMSLVSAMSNDENLTPAASTDFSQAARLVAEREGTVQAAEQEVIALCRLQSDILWWSYIEYIKLLEEYRNTLQTASTTKQTASNTSQTASNTLLTASMWPNSLAGVIVGSQSGLGICKQVLLLTKHLSVYRQKLHQQLTQAATGPSTAPRPASPSGRPR